MRSPASHNSRRRTFLLASSRTMVGALAACSGAMSQLFAKDQATSTQWLEQHLADVVATYDAQGNHRTATPADDKSAQWLGEQVRQAGAEPSFEPFALNRIDPLACYLRVAGRRIEGVPLFDAAFTGAEGIRGTIGPLDSDADIALVESEPFALIEPRKELGGPLAEARKSQHKGVVVLTQGGRPGLYLLNAPSFKTPFGPPTLQVSSAEGEWLKAQARQRPQTVFVAHVDSTKARAFNVTARIAGGDRSLAPIVVSTPRSGWWQCASERGGGLACWLEVIRALAAAKPERDCLFAAFSGHEIGFIGIDAFLEPRPGLMKRAHAWLHLGASIGAPRQPNLVQTSDASLGRWIAAALATEELAVDNVAQPETVPRGEAGTFHRGGARYITLVCGTEVFHSAADRWPEAIDVAMLARYARAVAAGVVELAQRRS